MSNPTRFARGPSQWPHWPGVASPPWRLSRSRPGALSGDQVRRAANRRAGTPGSLIRYGAGLGETGVGLSLCLRLHIVTEQRVLIPNIELAVRDYGMRPGRFVGAFGLIEPPA